MFIDSFDFELKEPLSDGKMTIMERDMEILRKASKVSIFWVTESQRRAKLCEALVKKGVINLDNSCGYPWLNIVLL